MKNKNKDLLIVIFAFLLVFQSILIFFLLRKRIIIPRIKKAKIAIVIDDWGYNRRNLDFVKEVDFPVNLSILPFLPHSKEIANEAKSNNLEIILHLPLEPHEYRRVGLEKKMILTNMSQEKVNQIIEDALKSVPYCKGISNHMGSKATEDEGLMKIIFDEMKRKRLYFLDSFVTPESVCAELSKKMKLKFAKRSIFLDNEADPYYIRGQLMSLLDAAARDGQAIGIGHDRKLTLEIIKEFVPKIDKKKIEIVFVSDLVQ
ncbi:MAG: divergent polysaccharide deacetylase family protein [Candidatus Omnitrophota bacterium]